MFSPPFCSPTRITKHCRDDTEVWFEGSVLGTFGIFLPSRSLIKKHTALPIYTVGFMICTQADKSRHPTLVKFTNVQSIYLWCAIRDHAAFTITASDPDLHILLPDWAHKYDFQ